MASNAELDRARRCLPLFEPVRDEAAGVQCHRPVVLADADAGGLGSDDPGADDGVVAVEGRQRNEGLVDVNGLGVGQAVALDRTTLPLAPAPLLGPQRTFDPTPADGTRQTYRGGHDTPPHTR